MSSNRILKILPGVLLLMSTLGVTRAEAQSVCVGAFLGAGGVQEICVNIVDTATGTTINQRGASGLNIAQAVGDYTVDLTFTFGATTASAAEAGGMVVVIEGTVERTTAGNGRLNVTADGGLAGIGIPTNGTITLIGTATDTSNTQLGGGAGFSVGADVAFTSLGLVTIDASTLGAGGFGGEKGDLIVTQGAAPPTDPVVAVRNITSFHLNNVNQVITVPSGAGVGKQPLPGATEALKLNVDGAGNICTETLALAATLDGVQEVPPVTTDGLGTAGLSFDTATNELRWTIVYSGLSGPATAAHGHGPALPGSEAGVQWDIGANSNGLTSPILGTTTLTDPQADELLDGLVYINIHTAANPGGEIRGQIGAPSCHPEHFPIEQFILGGGSVDCLDPVDMLPADHWHLVAETATSLEGSTITDPAPTGCGAARKSDVTVAESGEVTEDTEVPYSLTVGAGEALVIAQGATLKNNAVLTLTVADGGTLHVAGSLQNDGTVLNEAGGTINNTSNTTLNNAGTINNYGTINNTGTITNECGGVINNNTGTIIGNPIIEVPCSAGRLTNISTRGVVGAGDDVMIGGFIIGGSGPKTVLIRARGPALADFGVPGVLADPLLQLSDANGTLRADNDDWETTTTQCQEGGVNCGDSAAISATGLDPCVGNFTGRTSESAILLTLEPGNYTAQVSGGTGVGLVEVFAVVGGP